MTKQKDRNTFRIILLLCICTAGFIYTLVHKSESSAAIQKGIADQVIRFHVIANSDSKVDQAVKLVVKDEIVTYMQGRLADAKTRDEAEEIMKEEIPEIREIAQQTVEKEGYEYNCDVVYHTREFPVKVYGDLTFPAGQYEALDVVLGNAEGKNWWCVMFPTLCFVDGTYSVVPDESKDLLKNSLTDDEYQAIAKEEEDEEMEVEYDFKLAEWWDSLVDQFMKIVE